MNCTGSVDLNYPFTTDEPRGRHDHYLMYLTDGRLETLLGGETVLLTPGMCVLFPPEQAYRYTRVGNETVQYLWVHFTGSEAETWLTDCGLAVCGYWKTGLHESLRNGFRLLQEDFIRRDRLFPIASASHLAVLLVEVGRQVHRSEENMTTQLSKSIQYIHRAFPEEISSAELAEMEHLSVPRYNVLFRAQTGTSPRRYIIRLRMDNACELLLNTDLSHKQVAQLTGYSDPHYFSRVFHKQYGVSPEQYRANAREILKK